VPEPEGLGAISEVVARLGLVKVDQAGRVETLDAEDYATLVRILRPDREQVSGEARVQQLEEAIEKARVHIAYEHGGWAEEVLSAVMDHKPASPVPPSREQPAGLREAQLREVQYAIRRVEETAVPEDKLARSTAQWLRDLEARLASAPK
jgi:hypothetical protein